MKQNVKVFLIALVLGMGAAFFISYKYDNTLISNALENKITCFYVGSYNNLEEATKKKNGYPNSIIYQDEGIYRVLIGVYQNDSAMSIMESYFLDKGYNFKSKKIKASHEIINAISTYETLITSSDKTHYENINSTILKLFLEYIK